MTGNASGQVERPPEAAGGVPEQRAAVGRLAQTLSPALPVLVDELQVAAVLESRGINDAVAGEQYGHEDVFALASEVTQILLAAERAPGTAEPVRSTTSARRTLAHGPLYLAPSLAYPAIWTVVGEDMLRGMVTATAVGWIWGMATSSLAYQFRGLERERSAGVSQRWMMLAGIGTALLAVLAVTATGVGEARTGGTGAGAAAPGSSGIGGAGLVAYVVGQVAFQLGAGVLVFYAQEVVLALAAVPMLVSGSIYLVAGRQAVFADLTLATAVLCCALVVFVAWRLSGQALHPGPGATPQIRRRAVAGAAPSVVYAALCAVLLLSIDVRYLRASLDLAMAAGPLVLGMGAVEWRAQRFVEQSRTLLAVAPGTDEFRRRIWRLSLRELTVCGGILGVLACTQLLILGQVTSLTLRGATLVDAHVVLGCVFFLGFLLMSRRSFRWLLAVVAGVLVVHLLAVSTFAGVFAPHGEVVIFLITTTVLLLVFLVSFRLSLGRAYHSFW